MRNSKMRNRQHFLRKQTENKLLGTNNRQNFLETNVNMKFSRNKWMKTSLQADNPKDSFPIDIN